MENGEEIRSHKVVLGIGSTPKAEFTQLSFAPGYVHSLLQKNDGSCCVDDFAEIISRSSAPRTLVLIGSNAAAMENLYLIANTPAIRRSLSRVIVVSTSGSLPLTHTARMSSEPLCLESFAKQGPHTADKLFTAARNDMACVNGQSAVGFEGRFSTALKNALTILAVSEQSRFVELHGARLVSMNRHAPPEYLAAACRMISDGKLQLICGRVSAVKPPKSPSGSFLINVTTGSRHSVELHAAGVVDCRGSVYLCPPPNPLIRSILKENSGVGSINSSGRGIRVNKNFEASEGVYVIGPLLAGHSSETDWLWNLESAPRINSLAQRVAALVSHL